MKKFIIVSNGSPNEDQRLRITANDGSIFSYNGNGPVSTVDNKIGMCLRTWEWQELLPDYAAHTSEIIKCKGSLIFEISYWPGDVDPNYDFEPLPYVVAAKDVIQFFESQPNLPVTVSPAPPGPNADPDVYAFQFIAKTRKVDFTVYAADSISSVETLIGQEYGTIALNTAHPTTGVYGILLPAPEPEPVTEGLRGLRMRFPNAGTMKCVGAVIEYSTADGEVGGAVVRDGAKVNSANLNLLMTNIDQSILDDTFIQLNMTYGVTNIIEVLRMTREREVETFNRASSTTKHVQNFTCNRAVFLNDQAELVFVDHPPIELIDYRTDTLESATINDGISWSFLMSASYSIKALTDNGWEYIVNQGYINPSISPNEFKGNATFKEVYVHDSIVDVGASAFFGLVNLTYIRFPWLCDIVGNSALRNNTQLLQVDFGERVRVFDANSLFYCPVLEKITLPVVTAIPIVADQAFLLNDATIYVNAERVAEFKVSSYWSDLASRITAILD